MPLLRLIDSIHNVEHGCEQNERIVSRIIKYLQQDEVLEALTAT